MAVVAQHRRPVKRVVGIFLPEILSVHVADYCFPVFNDTLYRVSVCYLNESRLMWSNDFEACVVLDNLDLTRKEKKTLQVLDKLIAPSLRKSFENDAVAILERNCCSNGLLIHRHLCDDWSSSKTHGTPLVNGSPLWAHQLMAQTIL